MMSRIHVNWDGVTRAETLRSASVAMRNDVCAAMELHDWQQAIELVAVERDLANTTRLNTPSLDAPLHHLARSGGSSAVAERLIELGAWRTLRNVQGDRPIEVAEKLGHQHLLASLRPQMKHELPPGVLTKLQQHLHALIRERADRLVQEAQFRLPELDPLLELDTPCMFCPVPGMYGGFRYWLEEAQPEAGAEATLISESFCRVRSGSHQRHLITASGYERVALA